MEKQFPMTQEGLDKLKLELENLKLSETSRSH